MTPEIVFEDSSLLVINKPAGWITNEASTTKGQPVLQTWISTNIKSEVSKDREFRSGIVHRLDKETSGVLLIAKTKKAFSNLQAQFKARRIRKTYTALTHGVVEPRKGRIDASVGRLPWRRDRFGVLPGGRSALTSYETLGNYRKKDSPSATSVADFTLLKLFPKTGRTHQIRIHLKHIGHAVVADEFYAGRKTARDDREWCPRLFLHASGIAFKHPKTGKVTDFSAGLANDLQKALDTLESPSENNYS